MILKKSINIVLTSSLLFTHFAKADFRAPASTENYQSHPCANIIALENQQIGIMKNVRFKVTGDKVLQTTISTSIAADSGRGALKEAANGNALGAVLELLNVYVFSKQAVKNGTDGINKHFQQKDLLEQRENNLKALISHPELCTNETKSQYMLNFLSETKKINTMYLEFLNNVIAEAEARDTTKITATATLVAGVFTFAALQYFKGKPDSLSKFIVIPAGFLVTSTSGVMLASDILYAKPRKNALIADKMKLEQKINEIDQLESTLKSKMN